MAHQLKHFLRNEDHIAKFRSRVDLLQRCQRTVEKMLPASQSAHCRAANMKDEKTLVILTTSNAMAARLRQSVPSLLIGFQMEGLQIEKIQVRTQPSLQYTAEQHTPQAVSRNIGPDALGSIQSLCDALPADDPLRQSLEHLLLRCR